MSDQTRELIEFNKTIEHFHIIRSNEFPDLDLYMDQVLAYLSRQLSVFKIDPEDNIITSSMINNYVKFGIVSAIRQYSIIDNIVMSISMIGISMPSFWCGLLLMLLFCVKLKWLPASGFDSFSCVILPGIALGVNSAASIARMTRSSMLEVIRQDYISTARAKGLSEFKVVTVHALKNALIPVITTIGMQFGLLLGGAVLIESIFAIPGVGKMMVDAIKSRNYPVVQGGVLVIALSFCLVNLVVDILYAYVDPRVRSQYK